MLLDDLVGVIETLKERIATHGPSLRASETRTRMALIDPLLQALGWDTSDPAIVTPEYDVSGRKADYALLGSGVIPSATVEAKKLGEPLSPHRMQMLNYSNASGVEYAGLTDGDVWELYEVFKRGQLEERRILDVSIANTLTHEAALKLLLLWRTNLASGQPVAANAPALVVAPDQVIEPAQLAPITVAAPATLSVDPFQPVPVPVPSIDAAVEASWIPLPSIANPKGDKKPIGVRFPGSTPKNIKSWADMYFEVCQWLTTRGNLTADDCPIASPGGPGARVLRNTVAKHPPSRRHPSGNDFSAHRVTSAGLFVEINYNPSYLASNAKFLLEKFGLSPEIIELRFK